MSVPRNKASVGAAERQLVRCLVKEEVGLGTLEAVARAPTAAQGAARQALAG